MPKFNLKALRKTMFGELYRKFLIEKVLSRKEYLALLEIASLLLKANNREMRKLGQRIVTLYSLKTLDVKPLYEIALHFGFAPLVKLIESRHFQTQPDSDDAEVSFHTHFISAINENYQRGDIFLTEEQFWVDSEMKNNDSRSALSLVAPTSYGKSDILLSLVENYKGNVCILVPTKALISQTKKRLLQHKFKNTERLVITHPEVYNEKADGIVAIFTQERFLRLQNEHPNAIFEAVFVDEAHNLFENNGRSVLLATSIIVALARNKNCMLRYFTPFANDSKLLKLRHTEVPIIEYKVTEYLKTEKIYFYDFDFPLGLELYDQFIDDFFELGVNYESPIDLVLANSSRKNIVYLNKLPKIELIAKQLASKIDVLKSDKIEQACIAISEYVDPNYYLIDCLKKGILYHHSAIPDNIKLYIEDLFTKDNSVKYIVTTSTLLEGVNIPAEKLFILDYKKGPSKLTPAQFKNLIGRVCRFREIFDSKHGDIALLAPEVFVVKSELMPSTANVRSFLEKSLREDIVLKDQVLNVLLEGNSTKEKSKLLAADEYLENISPGVVASKANIRVVQTDFGRACYSNSVYEIDILECENECQLIINRILQSEVLAESASDILDLIAAVFLPYLKDKRLKRLNEEKALSFYKMFLEWKMENKSLKEMIGSFLGYWRRTEKINSLVFVGSKWGEIASPGSIFEVHVDISTKTEVERVNLAIVRIKEEQEFLDNYIIKFIEVLNQLNMISKESYLKVRYGTLDERKILLIKNGLSPALSSLLLSSDYKDHIDINIENEKVRFKSTIYSEMESNKVNDILLFEMGFII